MIPTPASIPGSTGFLGYFRELFEYDRWANDRVLDAMEGLSEVPDTAVRRMAHLVICQDLWVRRVREEEPLTDVFPRWNLEETRRQCSVISSRMQAFLDLLTEDRIHGVFDYVTTEGEKGQSLVSQILTQLSQHGCYHRGQSILEIKPFLAKPLDTDYVFFARARFPKQ